MLWPKHRSCSAARLPVRAMSLQASVVLYVACCLLLWEANFPTCSAATNLGCSSMSKANGGILNCSELSLNSSAVASLLTQSFVQGTFRNFTSPATEYELDLSGNRIANISTFSSVLSSFTVLSLRSNIIQSITSGDFMGLTNLTSLDLSYNLIKFISSGTFVGLPNILSLELSGNEISRIGAGVFDILPRLKHLDLARNDISVVKTSAFLQNSALEKLNISNNQLSAIVIVPTRNLSLLDIRDNNIAEFDASFLQYASPSIMFLCHGNFFDCDCAQSFIRNSSLPLNLIQIAAIEPSTCSCSIANKTFKYGRDCSQRCLCQNSTTVDCSAVKGTCRCKPGYAIHDCSFNLQSDCSTGCSCTEQPNRLLELTCRSQGRRNLPVGLSPFTGYLDLSNNTFMSVNATDFSRVSQRLQTLILRSNSITNLTSADFIGFNNLTTLDLSFNNISEVEVNTFNGSTHMPMVASIDLSNNKISYLGEGMFADLPFLQNLILSDNNLYQVASSALLGDSSLQKVVLSRNRLTEVSFLGSGIPSREIYLDENVLVSTTNLGSATSDLRVLNLTNNNITMLDFEFLKFTSVDFNSSNLLCSGNFFNCPCLQNYSSLASFRSNATSRQLATSAKLCACSQVNGLYQYGRDCMETCSCNTTNTISCDPLSGLCNCRQDYAHFNCSLNLRTECPIGCKCSSSSTGQILTDCSSSNHLTVPLGISPYTTVLDLTNNSLVTINGSDFANLPLIKSLSLGNNYISSFVEGGLSSLTRLLQLSLNNNQIKSDVLRKPSIFPRSLLTLSLTRNPISILPKDMIYNLSQLNSLFLESCNVTTIEDGAFNGGSNRMDLHLGFNKLNALGKQAFSVLGSRAYNLQLQNNAMRYIENGTFASLTALDFLNLRGNNFGEFLQPGVFAGLSQLSSLNLQISNITELTPGTFIGLSSTTRLDLSNNSLTYLQNGVLDGILTANLPFQSLHLDLQFNQISGIGSQFFAHTKINTALLNGNALTSSSLENGSLAHSNLLVVNLNWNNLTRITANMFNGNQLSFLTARNNYISELPNTTIFLNETATKLHLDDNMLSQTHLERGQFYKIGPGLSILSLAGNGLSDLKRSLDNMMLTNLDVSRNQFSSWSKVFGSASKLSSSLRVLNASQNSFRWLISFLNPSSLEELYLRGNDFRDFADLSQLAILRDVHTLDLSYNRLGNSRYNFSSVLSQMTNLNFLDLKGNMIQDLSMILPRYADLPGVDIQLNNLTIAGVSHILTNTSSRLTRFSSSGNYMNSSCLDSLVIDPPGELFWQVVAENGRTISVNTRNISGCSCEDTSWGLNCNQSCSCNSQVEAFAYRPQNNATCELYTGQCQCSVHWGGRACENYLPVRQGCFAINISEILDPSVNGSRGTTVDVDPVTVETCLNGCSLYGYYLAAIYNSSLTGQLTCGCLHDTEGLGMSNEQLCTSVCENTTCGGNDSVAVISSSACEYSGCECYNKTVNCTGISVFPTGIPPDTEVLDLSNNMIRTVPENAFSNIKRLLHLDLSNNLLISFSTTVLQPMYLNLAGNQLIAVTISSASLRELYLQDNNLTSQFFYLPVLPNIKTLNISNNRLSNFKFPNFVRSAINLTNLACDDNYFDCTCVVQWNNDSHYKLDENATNPAEVTGCACTKVGGLFRYGLNCQLGCDCVTANTNSCLALTGQCVCMPDYAVHNCSVNLLKECPKNCTCTRDTTLVYTKCRGQGFVSVPLGISPFTSTLDIGNNTLTSIRVGDFAGLVHLAVLSLDFNEISSIAPGVFKDNKVIYLDLANNKLAGSNLSSPGLLPQGLAQLTLTNNPVKFLPKELTSGYPSLYIIELSSCNLTAIEDGSFTGTGVSTLKLQNNNLTNLSAYTFAGAGTNLNMLNLDNNQISSIQDGAFDNLTSLLTLSLVGNNLGSSLTTGAFRMLSGVSRLSLSNCRITQLPQNVFFNMSSLRRLQLDGNLLTEVNDGVFNGILAGAIVYFKLTIDLRNNQISRLGQNVFSLSQIQSIDLSSNLLNSSTLAQGSLSNSLASTIYLDNNKLTYLSASMFNNSKLVTLTVRNNTIRNLPTTRIFASGIEYSGATLKLDDNRVQPSKTKFRNLGNIQVLSLAGNRLSAVGVSLAGLNFTSLDLSRNQLSSISGISPNSPLTMLNLSYNLLTDFSVPGLASGLASASLKYLYLDHNRIRSFLGLRSLAKFGQLHTLDLSHNVLTSPSFDFATAVIAKLLFLGTLSLQDNKLSTLQNVLTRSFSISALNISRNNLTFELPVTTSVFEIASESLRVSSFDNYYNTTCFDDSINQPVILSRSTTIIDNLFRFTVKRKIIDCSCPNNTYGLGCTHDCGCNTQSDPFAYIPDPKAPCHVRTGQCTCLPYWSGRACQIFDPRSHGCYNINTSVIFDPSDNRLGRAVDVTPFNLSACLTTCSSIGYYFSVPYRSIPGNVSCGCVHDYQDLGARNEAACTDRCGNVSCAGVNAGGVFSPPVCTYSGCSCNNTSDTVSCQLLSVVPHSFPATTRILILRNNNITRIEKSAFGADLANLQELDLSHNAISMIDPAAFLRLINLTRLDLSFNRLTSFAQSSIPDTRLSLNLASNQLIRANFDGVLFATELYLQNNDLGLVVDSLIFFEAPNLLVLNITNNSLSLFNHSTLIRSSLNLTSRGIDCGGNFFNCSCLQEWSDDYQWKNSTLDGPWNSGCGCGRDSNQFLTYGRDCSVPCTCQPNTTTSCNAYNGICTCKEDFALFNCTLNLRTECPSMCTCYGEGSFLVRTDCRSQGLSRVPTFISPHTIELDLTNNSITTLRSQDFASLTRLSVLHIRNNMVSSIDAGLLNSSSLLFVDFHGNNLNGSQLAKPKVFPNTTQTINLANNPIGFVPALFTKDNSFSAINLDNCSIVSIEDGSFSGVSNYSVIQLRNNQLTNITNNTFSSAGYKLSSLDLSSNNISSLEVGAFSQNTLMSILILSGNNLADNLLPDTFLSQVSLQRLDLGNSGITRLRRGVFRGLRTLSILSLRGNKLRSLQERVLSDIHATNPVLQTCSVYLSYNLLSAIGRGEFYNPAITNVYLSNNRLSTSSLNSGFLRDSNISYIDIDNNVITNLTNGVLPRNSLQFLSARNNRLERLPSETIFASPYGVVNELHLDNNRLINPASASFRSLGPFQVLSLAGNRISRLHNSLNDLNLTVLNISHNSLTTWSEIGLNQSRLISLDVSGNNYSDFILGQNSSGLLSLLMLNLSNNQISNVSGLQDLAQLTSLRSLDLSNNLLRMSNTSVSPDLSTILSSLVQLSSLYIQGNGLESLQGFIPSLPSLEYVNIAFNNLTFNQNTFQDLFGNVSLTFNIFTIDNYFNGTCLINAVINVEAVQRLPALATDPNKVYLLGARNIGDCGCSNSTYGLDCTGECLCNDQEYAYSYRPDSSLTCSVRSGQCSCLKYWAGRACQNFTVERSGCYAVNISAFTPGNTLGSFINATGFTLESCLSNCSSMGYYFAAPFVPSTGNQLMCGCLHNFQHLDLQSDSRCNSTCGISMCGGLDAAGIYSPQACDFDGCSCNTASSTVTCRSLNVVPHGLPTPTRRLLLQGNNIMSVGRNDFGADLVNLQELDLSHNEISMIHVAAFSQLVSLTKLDLSYNRLTRFYASAIPNTRLSLNLANNKLVRAGFGGILSISELYLQNNSLGLIDGSLMFEEVPFLSILNINNNSLSLFNHSSLLRSALNLNSSGLYCAANFFNCTCLQEWSDDYQWKNTSDSGQWTNGCGCGRDSNQFLTYGRDCSVPCTCQPNTTTSCNAYNGICTCKEDFALFNCTLNLGTECPAGCTCYSTASHLIRTDCRSQGFPRVPKFISPHTIELDLTNNSITTLRSRDFAGLTNLRILYLGNNMISSIETGALNTSVLFYINLEGNSLSGSQVARPGIFPNVTREIDLSNNPIGVIMAEFTMQVYSLSRVTLVNCSITMIEDGSFSGMAESSAIVLRNNQLSAITNNTFQAVGNRLFTLDLSDNNISKVDVGSFSRNRKLFTLNLSGNNLTKNLIADTFLSQALLQRLDLGQSGITHLASGVFRGLSSLSSLSLRGNELRSLQGRILSDIQDTNPVATTIHVDLSHNLLNTIDRGEFSNPGITRVNLDTNQLNDKSLKSGFLVGANISYIDIDNNYVTNLTNDMLPAAQLFYLSVRNNTVAGLPTSPIFSALSTGNELHLDFNNLRNPSAALFQNLGGFQVLSLAGNGISSLHNSLSGLNLTLLNISNNLLSRWNDFGLSQSGLTTLDASHNQFSYFSVRPSRSGLLSLRTLDLSYNRISSTTGLAGLANVSSLATLDLSYNLLHMVNSSTSPDLSTILNGLYQLNSLNLRGNWLKSLEGFVPSVLSLYHIDIANNNLTFNRSTYQDLFGNVSVPFRITSFGNFFNSSCLIEDVDTVQAAQRVQTTNPYAIYHVGNRDIDDCSCPNTTYGLDCTGECSCNDQEYAYSYRPDSSLTCSLRSGQCSCLKYWAGRACQNYTVARSGCFAVNLTTFEPTVNYTIGTYINATAFTLESCLSNCSSMGYYFAAPFVPSTGNQLMCGCLHNYQHLDLQMDLRCNETCGASMCGGIESAGVYSPLACDFDSCSCTSDRVQCTSLHVVPHGIPVTTVSLILRSNSISSVDSKSFTSQHIHLQVIDLSQNRISTIAEDAFSSLTSLTQLFLSHNLLTRISSWLPRNIDILDLSNNNIFKADFAANTGIRKISLQNNSLGLLPGDALIFSIAPELNLLSLQNNSLGLLPGDALIFSIAPELNLLSLQNNSLGLLPGDALIFSIAPELNLLNIMDNYLTSFNLSTLIRSATNFSSSRLFCDGNLFNCSCAKEWVNDLVWKSNVNATNVAERTACACSLSNGAYTYGRDCSQQCTCQTNTTTACSPRFGHCTCVAGYALANCSLDLHTECPASCNCTSLVSFFIRTNCSGRGLTSVPSGISPFTELLDLSHNRLTSLGRANFSSLSFLASLDVSHNNISDIESNAFATGGLSVLNLRNNLISSRTLAVPDILPGSIVELDMSHNNPLTMVPKEFASNHTKLSLLTLANCQIASIEDGAFAGLSTFAQVILTGNKLTTISNGTFNATGHRLYRLFLDNNQISKIETGAFYGLSNLLTLMLDGNNIQQLPDRLFTSQRLLEQLYIRNVGMDTLNANVFSGLRSISMLALSGNKLTSIPDGVFDDLQATASFHLRIILDLSNNSISSISQRAFSNPHLDTLYLSNNQLEDKDLEQGCLVNTTLSTLYLDGNRLSHLTDNMFSNAVLQYLNLQNNAITTLPSKAVLGPLNLNLPITLRVDNNQLHQLPSNYRLSSLGRIAILSISGNQLTTLQPSLDGLSPQILDVSRNNLTTLANIVNVNWSSLHSLNISRNHLTTFDTGTFQGTISPLFSELDISFNKLSSIRFTTTFPFLRSLYASHNLITSDHLPLLGPSPTLQDLYLSENLLTTAPGNLFLNLTGLARLDVSNNRIVNFSRGLLRYTTDPVILMCYNTFFNCSCARQWIANRQWLVARDNATSAEENCEVSLCSVSDLQLQSNVIGIPSTDLFEPGSSINLSCPAGQTGSGANGGNITCQSGGSWSSTFMCNHTTCNEPPSLQISPVKSCEKFIVNCTIQFPCIMNSTEEVNYTCNRNGTVSNRTMPCSSTEPTTGPTTTFMVPTVTISTRRPKFTVPPQEWTNEDDLRQWVNDLFDIEYMTKREEIFTDLISISEINVTTLVQLAKDDRGQLLKLLRGAFNGDDDIADLLLANIVGRINGLPSPQTVTSPTIATMPEPPDSSPIPVIAGAAGGGLVLIAVAIFVIIVYRRKTGKFDVAADMQLSGLRGSGGAYPEMEERHNDEESGYANRYAELGGISKDGSGAAYAEVGNQPKKSTGMKVAGVGEKENLLASTSFTSSVRSSGTGPTTESPYTALDQSTRTETTEYMTSSRHMDPGSDSREQEYSSLSQSTREAATSYTKIASGGNADSEYSVTRRLSGTQENPYDTTLTGFERESSSHQLYDSTLQNIEEQDGGYYDSTLSATAAKDGMD